MGDWTAEMGALIGEMGVPIAEMGARTTEMGAWAAEMGDLIAEMGVSAWHREAPRLRVRWNSCTKVTCLFKSTRDCAEGRPIGWTGRRVDRVRGA
ncbi:hypothetical protein GCM10028789_14280 [Sinomonas halotolerans]